MERERERERDTYTYTYTYICYLHAVRISFSLRAATLWQQTGTLFDSGRPRCLVTVEILARCCPHWPANAPLHPRAALSRPLPSLNTAPAELER